MRRGIYLAGRAGRPPARLEFPGQVRSPRWILPRVLALADQIESDPAAAQEPLAREAYRLRHLTQEVAAGLAERRLAEIPAAPSPTRRWCG